MKRLTKLANKYKTDKGDKYSYSHAFTEFYEPYFLQFEKPTILELGVAEGATEKMLNDFYDGDCEIYCVDIEDKSEIFADYPNIHFYQSDLGYFESIEALLQTMGDVRFDIIIDDASHVTEHQYLSLLYFRKVLKKNGIFVMEDLHVGLPYFATEYCQSYETSVLNFLSGFRENELINGSQYEELSNSIKDIIIFSRKNDKNYIFNGRSVTSIITFENGEE